MKKICGRLSFTYVTCHLQAVWECHARIRDNSWQAAAIRGLVERSWFLVRAHIAGEQQVLRHPAAGVEAHLEGGRHLRTFFSVFLPPDFPILATRLVITQWKLLPGQPLLSPTTVQSWLFVTRMESSASRRIFGASGRSSTGSAATCGTGGSTFDFVSAFHREQRVVASKASPPTPKILPPVIRAQATFISKWASTVTSWQSP